jgi:hypothetical protein
VPSVGGRHISQLKVLKATVNHIRSTSGRTSALESAVQVLAGLAAAAGADPAAVEAATALVPESPSGYVIALRLSPDVRPYS